MAIDKVRRLMFGNWALLGEWSGVSSAVCTDDFVKDWRTVAIRLREEMVIALAGDAFSGFSGKGGKA